jgi:glycosyltransferase involved in cell wall biosynthesis
VSPTAEPEAPAVHVLHVGSGYRPLRWGGLVAYIEDLSREQVRQGMNVSYLFSGRYLRWPRGPRLVRGERDGVAMFEIVNSPLHDHGRQPELELAEPALEAMFREVLEECGPDVVHFQELAGLPFSLLAVTKEAGIPSVLTLQDYFPLCPTFKLLDADGRVCLRHDIGLSCRETVQADPRRPSVMYESSARRELADAAPLRMLPHKPREKALNLLTRPRLAAPPAARSTPLAPASAFQARRDTAVELLNGTDRLIAMSNRVAEIYAELGVDPALLTTMQLTLAHIDELTLRRREPGERLTFATLGGGESIPKGTAVLLQALSRLRGELEPGSFRLLVFGRCQASFESAISSFDEVERRPRYRPVELDGLLEEVDVGIMPSIWEEAYGYAGIEFIAKGIPVIANPIGGMRDYVRQGETGWLNESASGRALSETMARLITHPEEVAQVTRSTRGTRPDATVSMADHARAVASLYAEVGA